MIAMLNLLPPVSVSLPWPIAERRCRNLHPGEKSAEGVHTRRRLRTFYKRCLVSVQYLIPRTL